ncbi:MAG: hypothetical protein V4612_07530 [Pseudomonadota bacterium]
MTQTDISDNKNQKQNYPNDSNSNYLNPTTKIWFYIPFSNWFLTKDEKNPLQGIESWFDSPTKVSQTVNKPKKRNRIDVNSIDIKISKDPELLKQYYDLREESYRNDSGFKNYSGDENNFDRNGVIFLGVMKGKVVAGARLVVSSEVDYLPHEDPEKHFIYPEICKTINIDLKGVLYSEVSALTISKELRVNFLDKLFQSMVEHCRENNIKYIFGVSDMKCSRDYKMSFSKLRVPFMLASQIVAPRKTEFNNIDSYLVVAMP